MVLSSTTFSRRVPGPVPVLTLTVRTEPVPVTLVIDAPLTDPVVVRLKSEAFTPVTASEKVTTNFTDESVVGLALMRTLDTTVGAESA